MVAHSITGGYVALCLAINKLIKTKYHGESSLDYIIISCGIVANEILVTWTMKKILGHQLMQILLLLKILVCQKYKFQVRKYVSQSALDMTNKAR